MQRRKQTPVEDGVEDEDEDEDEGVAVKNDARDARCRARDLLIGMLAGVEQVRRG